VLVSQPLVNRRLGHPRRQLRGDVIAVRADLSPGHLPQPRVGQLREPLLHQASPLRLGHRRPARRHPRRQRRRQVLADRLAVHAQRLRQLVLRPARMPVDQDLRYIDHVKRSPRHRLPLALAGRKGRFQWSRPDPARHAHHPPEELTERRAEELRERHTASQGKSLSADRSSGGRAAQ
jgi:hypothetical protein